MVEKEIKQYQFKKGLPLEFEILQFSNIYKSKKKLLTTPHRVNFYHIIWIEKGKGSHFVDFKPVELQTDNVLFVPKDCINLFDTSADYEAKIILFTDNFFCKNHNDVRFLHSTILYHDLYDISKIRVNPSNSPLRTIMSALETEYAEPKDNAQYDILRNLLHNFLLISERKRREQGFVEVKPGINLDYLLLYKKLLEKNFKKEKTVSKYASDLSLSEKQLNKATTKILGKTPKQIIDERVILEAKRLLAHSSLSIKELGYELGFDEPTNFIKYFRKHVNATPSEFREQYQ